MKAITTERTRRAAFVAREVGLVGLYAFFVLMTYAPLVAYMRTDPGDAVPFWLDVCAGATLLAMTAFLTAVHCLAIREVVVWLRGTDGGTEA